MSTLLTKLEERYTLLTHPDVATTVEQSLIQLSLGIYTEEERFIYELLQNAVDAFTEQDRCLEIKMVLQNHHLVFMHNGNAFTARDFEGLCDVGNGNKTQDVRKIGYKGIGFKSVFMRSSCVTVKSGEYCFKFDKAYWKDYWETNWKEELYGKKDQSKNYLMPWQIIPLACSTPIRLSTKGFNVVTYIEVKHEELLVQKICNLMKNSQFLLFLKSDNIHMTFSKADEQLAEIGKTTQKDIVTLSKNGKAESRWLVYNNNDVEVPTAIREDIANDINTPQKLKDAQTFDISFAVEIEKRGHFKPLDEKEAVLYTYLPTSFKFGDKGFPFLVNANFITDAGRQQLHKDSAWNKMIFSKIPSEFLTWMSTVSSHYDNYYEALPHISYGEEDALQQTYKEHMAEALRTIAFIPSTAQVKQKVLAKDAFVDKTGIAGNISLESFVSHINRTYGKNFTPKNQVAYHWKSTRILTEYGVFNFGKQELKALFEDTTIFHDIDIEYDLKLIDFLWQYTQNNPKEKDDILHTLSETKFILDEKMDVREPSQLYFPTDYREENELAADIVLMNPELFERIENQEILDWLKKMDMKELSNKNFIHYLAKHPDYINEDNALDIGRYLFKINQKDDFVTKKEFEYELSYIKFLTKDGTLQSASDLYFGSAFKPEFDIESVCQEDIFISEDYCTNESKTEWKAFLLHMGVHEDIEKIRERIYVLDDKFKKRFDSKFLAEIKSAAYRYYWVSYDDFHLDKGEYRFVPEEIVFNTFPFINKIADFTYSRLVLNRILTKYEPKSLQDNESYVLGYTGMISRIVESYLLSNIHCEINHFRWITSHCSVIPTVQGCTRLAKDVFSNTIPQIQEIAGNYLPVIDLDEPITEEWLEYLQLKIRLTFDDYLNILSQISEDEENREYNKERVALIYQSLIDGGVLTSESQQKKIRTWSKSNRMLSKDGMLQHPQDLSYVSLEGFSTKNQVYIGTQVTRKEQILELMKLFGIDVITESSIKPEFENKQEKKDLKEILKSKISPLAILVADKNSEKETYLQHKQKLTQLLDATHFYHCERIALTYGNADDVITKHTFGCKNEFYYIGDLRPANVEPLLSPLCKYLGLKNKERELFIVMIEDLEGIRQNLEDKGYQTTWLEETQEPTATSGTLNVRIDYVPDNSAEERNRITGFKGEILVYEKLKAMGYEPICPSISTEADYEYEVKWQGQTYYCKSNYDKYDISFITHNGIEMFVEVKTTTLNKESQENMPISYREISMVEACNDDTTKAYIIARVFGIDSDTQDIYLFKAHLLK